jgi:serine/threonine protein kinase
MSQTISHEKFVNRLRESGLLTEFELRAALDGSRSAAGLPDARSLALRLVDTGRLTSFQADAILEGRATRLFIGQYTILNRLGAGGMGKVFKARHRSMKRIVALKMLSRDASESGDHTERFQREVEAIAQLSHPNIVMAYDAGEVENGLYLVMEYVDGRDLASDVSQGGPLSMADAVNCIVQAARGLGCAHDHGIVHRDVKPANLLRASSGVVKVTDLGLAHLGNSPLSPGNASLTLAGSILGTADYIAPEQALDSASIDHRVDIYSLGCTLFFLLAGRPMYFARSLMALLLRHRDSPIPSLSHVRADVPGELDEIYRRMVAKRPEERYPTMAEVVALLERVQEAVSLSSERPLDGGPAQRSTSPTGVTKVLDPSVPTDSADFHLSDSHPGETVPPTPSDVRRVSDLTVVLVESSRFQARIARSYLQELHIENVLTADSGHQALELAKREGTNVILSAMYLSDMTGAQLAQAIRQDPRSSGVGFVLASSDRDGGEAVKSMGVPLTAVIPKPLELRGLAQALAKATGRIVEEILS